MGTWTAGPQHLKNLQKWKQYLISRYHIIGDLDCWAPASYKVAKVKKISNITISHNRPLGLGPSILQSCKSEEEKNTAKNCKCCPGHSLAVIFYFQNIYFNFCTFELNHPKQSHPNVGCSCAFLKHSWSCKNFKLYVHCICGVSLRPKT